MSTRLSRSVLSKCFAGAAAGALAMAAGAQPANDLCVNAIVLPVDTLVEGTNVGATGTNQSSCAGTGDVNDVWYEFFSTEEGSATFQVCAGSFDTTLSIFTDCFTEIACDDDGCGSLKSRVQVQVDADTRYLVRVAGFGGATGTFTVDVSVSAGPNPGEGADVVYTSINGISNYGQVGDIRAYALGSNTCNIGNANLIWGANGSPVLAMNAYKILDGRLTQIGLGWGKTACCAAAGSGCGIPCNGAGGSVLGAGCLDVYGSGFNGSQFGLAPRANVNAFTGDMTDAPGGSGDAIFKRLQINVADLQPAGNPGAQYFVEGVYVGTDDAQDGNALNNASYQRVNVNGSLDLSLTGATVQHIPAIQAWRDHGLGAGVPDTNVFIDNADVPGEGRFILAHTVRDNGDGTWRYEYAIFNLNSDRSGGGFRVPIPAGVTVSNTGFNDVDYHSGEVYDNTDWTVTVAADEVVWASPQTFAQNPNSNALRWATMYNFWFDADTGPADGAVTLDLFKPGTPGSIDVDARVPAVECAADWNGDLVVDSGDFFDFISEFLAGDADFNNDMVTNSGDFFDFIAAFLEAC